MLCRYPLMKNKQTNKHGLTPHSAKDLAMAGDTRVETSTQMDNLNTIKNI